MHKQGGTNGCIINEISNLFWQLQQQEEKLPIQNWYPASLNLTAFIKFWEEVITRWISLIFKKCNFHFPLQLHFPEIIYL